MSYTFICLACVQKVQSCLTLYVVTRLNVFDKQGQIRERFYKLLLAAPVSDIILWTHSDPLVIACYTTKIYIYESCQSLLLFRRSGLARAFDTACS